MNAGVIVAAGKGTRYGSYKQVEPLLGKKVYQYALDVFVDSELIDIIYLVVNKDLYGIIEKDLNQYNTSKSIILCEGGDTRAKSVYNATMLIDQKYDKICIHDAVRPLITKKDIKNVLLNCPDKGGCVVGRKICDTIKKTDDTNIVETIKRDDIWLSQTPQAFCFKTLRNCYKDNFADFTDEASLLESQKCDIQIIESINTNIKITNEKDIELAKQLLSNNITGMGIDFHSLVPGKHLIVGGHKIDCAFSSKAHSDGDVLTHAIIDALLGALNLGDIGEHFPNTPEYLNISSVELLKKIVEKIPNNQKILYVDTSIVLNEPKISPHKKAMKKSLANVLGINTDQISIKSTTTNGLQFIDMSSGWGAQAIISLGNDI